MPFDPDGLQDEATIRRHAREYITKRLDEGRDDAIEELSAYLAQWLMLKQRARRLMADMENADG